MSAAAAMPSTSSRPATAVARRSVRIGTETLGGSAVPVIAGPRRGAHLVHITLRRHHGAVAADSELRRVRDLSPAPLLVEPFSADDLDAAAEYADGLVVGGASMQDFRLLTAVGGVGLPVVVHRGPHCTVGEWLAAVAYVRSAGTDAIVLGEAGGRRYGGDRPALDLALVGEARERSGLPVVVDVGATPWLAGAAVAAGADGVWLDEDAAPADVDAAREAATVLSPLVRGAPGGSLAGCREAIDRVDAVLASLFEHRAALAAEVQGYKDVPGHAGRDAAREAEIVRMMATRAPSLSQEHLTRIMDAVIAAGLDTVEASPEPPVWRL